MPKSLNVVDLNSSANNKDNQDEMATNNDYSNEQHLTHELIKQVLPRKRTSRSIKPSNDKAVDSIEQKNVEAIEDKPIEVVETSLSDPSLHDKQKDIKTVDRKSTRLNSSH